MICVPSAEVWEKHLLRWARQTQLSSASGQAVIVSFSRGHPAVLLRFNNIMVFESEPHKQKLFTRNKATSFGTVVPSSDRP